MLSRIQEVGGSSSCLDIRDRRGRRRSKLTVARSGLSLPASADATHTIRHVPAFST